jgi:hypothetical protein
MTFAQMRAEAEILYESINSSDAPGFLDTEWGSLFTVAQRRIVRKILEEGLEKGILSMTAIAPLIESESETTITTDSYFLNSDGTAAFTLDTGSSQIDDEYFWILDEYVTTANYSRIPLLRKSFHFYQKNLDNPFTSPSVEEGFWVISVLDEDNDNTHRPVFITDGKEPTAYKFVGVKHPDTYSIASGSDCVLNEGVQSEIVKEAVVLAHMSVLDPNGFQLTVTDDQRLNY